MSLLPSSFTKYLLAEEPSLNTSLKGLTIPAGTPADIRSSKKFSASTIVLADF